MNRSLDALQELGLRPDEDIAIVGMSGYFPASPSLKLFWDNIKHGRDCIERADSNSALVVNARGMLADIDKFDADFFGLSPEEATSLDPQHRLMLESVWSALDQAAIDPGDKNKLISVYLACAPSTYNGFTQTVARSQAAVSEQYQRMIATAPDFIATRVSYLLDLRGESMVVSTGCSSSLVAVHNACQSLLIGQSHIAVAGGVTIDAEQLLNYTIQDGMIFSRDGYCRAFDDEASGTVPASGVGVVVLKRLADAVEHNDCIHAVIKSSAVNNDGHSKVGFMAPSVAGQSKVIASALAIADIPVETIGYVEAHGTGTLLGDPIEVHALTKAYQQFTKNRRYCALASLKANFGHMDRASGVAGLIKAVLCLKNKTIPKSIHFNRANSEIPFDDSPFYVPTETMDWDQLDNSPRRAGVSSFGVGGTNAHVILQEWSYNSDNVIAEAILPRTQVLKFSAQSEAALNTLIDNMLHFVQAPVPCSASSESTVSIHNLAYSLQSRASLRYRTAIAVQQDVVAALKKNYPVIESSARSHCALVFPGQGMLIEHGGEELYRTCDVFRQAIGECIDILPDQISATLEDIVLGRAGTVRYSKNMQPVLLALEYAYAKQWLSMGVTPQALIGHSIGELAAACISGVFDLSSVLYIAIKRGELMERCVGRGKMLSALCSLDEVLVYADDCIEVAAINSTSSCTVSGSNQDIATLAANLSAAGIRARVLELDFAAHSSHMDDIIETFVDYVAHFEARPGQLLIISSLTGKPVHNAEMNTPDYWGQQLRSTVRFKDCIESAMAQGIEHFIECGPSQVLSQLIQQSFPVMAYPSGTSLESGVTAIDQLAIEVGHLWEQGFDVQWPMEPCQKLELPNYPFQRRSFWHDNAAQPATIKLEKSTHIGSWLHTEQWQVDAAIRAMSANIEQRMFVFICFDASNDLNTAASQRVTNASLKETDDSVTALTAMLERRGAKVLRLTSWSALESLQSQANITDIIDCREISGDGLLSPADALSQWLHDYQSIQPFLRQHSVNLIILGTGYFQTEFSDPISPLKKMQRSLIGVMQQEWLGLTTKTIDIGHCQLNDVSPSILLAEITSNQTTDACIRDAKVWRKTFRQAVPALRPRTINPQGVFVITGGLGHVGQALAEVLARYSSGVIVLLSRTAFTEQTIQQMRCRWAIADNQKYTLTTITADVSSKADMQQAAETIYATYGVVTGIIHAAAFTDSNEFKFLDCSTTTDCHTILDAKVKGVLHIDECFNTDECDFVLLCSSLSSEIGGLRYGIYASANAFLDGYALAKNAAGHPQWLAVAWDAWMFEVNGYTKHASLESLAMRVVEGQEVFLRSLSAEGGSMAISTCPLQCRIEQTRQTKDSTLLANMQAGPIKAADIGKIVKEVTSDIIGERVGEHYNFSEQGVDSLTTLQVITTLKRRLGCDLPLGDVFRTLDIGGLIEVAEACYQAREHCDAPIIMSQGDGDEYPTSALQSRWLEVAKNRYGYIQMPVKLVGKLNVPALEKSLASIFARHSVLRTVYQERPGEDIPVQHILNIPFQLLEIDMRTADKAQQQRQWEAFVIQESEHEFDFATEVPVSIKLLKFAEGEHILWCHMHHIAFDGTSSTLFFEELDKYYSAALAGGEYNPPAVLQYRDFSVWQRTYLTHQASNKAREYWQHHFAGCSGCLRIPATHHNPSAYMHDSLAAFHNILLDAKQANVIRQFASDLNTTVFTLFTAAFTILLYKMSTATDVVFGTTLAGRSELGAEDIMGVFVNPLPVRSNINLQHTFSEHVSSTADNLLGFHEHQNYPLESLVQEVDPFIGTDINETFRCYILMQNYPKASDTIGDLRMSKVSVEGLVMHQLMRDFELTIYPIGDGFTLEFGYRCHMYRASDVEEWGQWYLDILQRGVDNAQQTILDVSLPLKEVGTT